MLDAAPFFFGKPDAPLFGWVHAPEPRQALALGLVICNPFGFEEICAHRSLGYLARMAAEAGVAALRFDYSGCGNSSGIESDPDTLTRWVASIHLAVDTLKQRIGVQHVVLAGLRLGATLAALAAAQRSDVVAVVAIAPVVQGRLYLRELRILAETVAGGGGLPTEKQHGLESAGFLLTQEAVDSLGALDLRKMTVRPAHNVLIVDRDDLPVQPQWAEALVALGADVRAVQWPGYRAMMADPQSSLVPIDMFAKVALALKEWSALVEQVQPTLGTEPESGKIWPSGAYVTRVFHERAVQIRVEGGILAGLLTTPAGETPSTRGVLLINAGSVHSIGPNRLWVRLARRWAAYGITVVRLDLSGLGDSPARVGRTENVVYSAEAGNDIAMAVRYMREQLHIQECQLLGLCSGAFHGFKAAVSGVPLASTVLINPLTFFWELGKPLNGGIKDYEVVAQGSIYGRKIFSLESWYKLFRGQLDQRYVLAFAGRKLGTLLRPGMEAMAHLLGIPLQEDLARELRMASRSGVQHFVFASGEPGIKILRTQGKRSVTQMLSQGRVTIDLVPDADHTFTRMDARDCLVEVLDRLVIGGAQTT
ncbi:MAG: alpha/beta hydrolase [Burkholderiales bacterium]|nr:alpha/beta hydrolase [Burkholderiales bacterium]